MDRRSFLKSGSLGLGGMVLGGSQLPWLIKDAVAASVASGQPWKFGVMADTQWTATASGTDPINNPGTCAAGIIRALNQQFINHGVKFVVQVGDLVDKETWTVSSASGYSDPFGYAGGTTGIRTLPYRAWAAQDLYDAGIGFFPVRGNHEASATAANEMPLLFPQVTGSDKLFGVSNVIASSNSQLEGLSYAFDFDNVRIVLIDQFTRKNNTNYNGSSNNNAVDQVAWVDSTLADRPSDMHAFVMSHKNLSGQNHKDCLFGSSSTSNQTSRDAFIASLDANKVGFYLGGHDHMHYRSIIKNSGMTKSTEQIICASNSYKFYIPKTPYDAYEKAVAQELFTVGFYIFTVDGPSVTVDFYSASHGGDYGDADLTLTPDMTFFKRERFGYSLNGKEFVVANNEAYSVVQDSFQGTAFKILDGVNADTANDSDYGARDQVKTVKTGWKDRPQGCSSAVLKLWGLANNLSLFNAALEGALPAADGDYVTDTYVASLSYDATSIRPSQLVTGRFCIAARNDDGEWINAVDLNEGGTRKFVLGRWKSTYALGTFGVDPTTKTAWAVLNRDGEFVVRNI